ncbi:MAG: hypothetical protein GYB31_09350 [Bacteroidetes bacterium]|nr:hypothetical protein [Bacteroidota bacterium]
MDLKYFFLFALLILGGTSCMTFSQMAVKPKTLSKENPPDLSGTYAFMPKRVENYKKEARGHFINLSIMLDRHLMGSGNFLDTSKVDRFELQIVDENRLQFRWLERDSLIYEEDCKMKVDKEGYVRLKNKNIKFILLPYVMGALDYTKLRFALNGDGDLVCDVATHRSGAFLFFVFFSWNTSKYRLSFPKLEPGD